MGSAEIHTSHTLFTSLLGSNTARRVRQCRWATGITLAATFFALGAASEAAHASAKTVKPLAAQTQTLGEIDVTLSPYSANTTGASDDTAIFNQALKDAAASGALVKVPPGQYLFSGSLTIPAQVVLEGSNEGERLYAGYSNGTGNGDVKATVGTVFLVAGGGGSLSGASFATLNANSALRDVTIYYPNQPLSTTANWKAPTAYPPALNLAGRNATVENVCGVNPYWFIAASGLSDVVRRVSGQPLFVGINIDSDADATGQSGDRVEDVHFLDTWDNHAAMLQYMQSGSSAFVTYRADEFAMRNCTCTGYQNGFIFSRSGSGTAYGTLTSCSAYNCAVGVSVNACTQGAGGGLVFDGGGFGNSTVTSVSLSNTNTGSVTFNSCRFFNAPNSLAVNASLSGSVVSFLACSFDTWKGSSGVFCGDFSNPSTASGKTRILSCNFGLDQPQYAYTPGEASVLFEDNSTVNGIKGTPGVTGPNYIQANNF